MSDRDTIHMLDELQHARSVADSMERAFRQANVRCVELMAEVDRLREQLRWRDAHTEPPTIEDRYIVATCRKGFGSWSDNYWENGRWEIEPVDYWRPIGPLPCKGGA
jgi:hypothetical protein